MNKKCIKKLTYIIASFILVIGGIFTYTLINNKKAYFSDDDILLAAANYIESNNIGIGEELQIPVSLLKTYGFLSDDVACSNDSYITVKNVNGEYLYESNLSCNNITSITNNVVYMTANTINETIAPQVPLAYKGPTYSITDRTNKNVTVTIVTNLDILEVVGWDQIDSKTISKTFSTNSTETITIYAKNSVNNYRQISINVNNIDKYEPTVTGVVNGTTYTKDVTIGFSKVFNGSIVPVTATLNGQNFENGQVVSTDGDYTLVVTDDIGNSKTVSFTVDKTAPEVTGVENGKHYNQDVTINFNEGTATLNGSSITSGHSIIANNDNEGKYELVVTDAAGNKNEITFWIDITGSTVLKDEDGNITGITYSPALIDGKTSADTIVTITYNEEISLAEGSDWSISSTNPKQIYKQFNGENGIVTNVSDTIQVNDLAGNPSESVNINFIIDKKAPSATDVTYSPVLENGRTTSDTTVTIIYDEAIKLVEDSEWAIVEGTTNQITRTFTGAENAETVVNENIFVTDLVGNASAETTINFTIDKKVPVVTDVTYSPALENGRTNSDTTVTITYSEAINLPANWNYVVDSETGLVDNTKITRTFTGAENAETVVNEIVVVTDLIGNAGAEETINFTIDKKAPVVTNITYIPNLINGNLSTQDVIVVVTYDEAIKTAPENWEFVNGTTNQITRTFTGENGKETTITDSIVVEDLVGNTSEETAINFTIDKKAPVVTDVTYSPALENERTASDTTVTITYDEAIKLAEDSEWAIVEGTNNTKITRTFTGVEDEETIVNETVSVEDLYGNTSEETRVNFTIDKKAPAIVGEVEYSPALTGENVTNVDTTVTITYNEAIKLAEDSEWTIVEGTNNTKITRKFVGEAKAETVVNEGVVVTDLVGNTSEEITINFTIDKEAPTGVVTVNPSVPTKGPVILTLETNEDVIITNLASSNVYQCEEGNNRKYCVERDENGSFSFKFKDLAGNTGRVSYEVTNIDNEAPERVGEIEYSPVLKDGRTASDTTVTITYNEAVNLPENWSYVVDSETGVEDNTKITRTFTGVEDEETFVNENVIVTDLAGNESEEDSINFTIDKKAPEIVGEVEYSPALENGRTATDTTVTITYNEAIKLAEGSEWTIVEGTNNTKITRTFTGVEDEETIINETVSVEDLVGNTSVETSINFTIDKEAPRVIVINYSQPIANGRTASDITVKITYSEAIKLAEDSEWTIVEGTNNTQIERTFTGAEDAETVVNETISVEDLVGNPSVETSINFTIDKKAPEIVGEVEYSPALKDGRTNSDTVVIITYNEAVNLPANWSYVVDSETGVANNTKITKTFTGTEDIETIVSENVFVTDLVGNPSTFTSINFTIDKKAPSVTDVTYSPILENGRTTSDTTVTIKYDEAIKLAEDSEWTIVEGTTNQITRTFTGAENAETVVNEGVVVTDLVGNTSAETIINFTIDKTAPVVTDVTYSPALENGRTNSDTTVTITYSEAVNLPANWDYVVDSETGIVDNTKITRTFTGTEDAETIVNESVVATDLIGNAGTEETINFTIDKKAPVVTNITYIPDLINGNLSTQDVIVVVTYDETLKAAPENWEFVNGTTNQITRTFTGENGKETTITDSIVVEDLVGNASEETSINFTIDKKAPVVTDVTYSPALESGRTTSDTTVTITYDEAIKTAPENWEFVNGTTNQITRTFTGVEDEETIVNEKVSVEDLYGNASEETSINFTIDKKAPEIVGEVEYSPALTGENVTNVDTTVTITYNEAIKLAEDSEWTIVEGTNNTKITRKFVGEAKAETVVNEGVVVTDLVGNTSEEITINFTIDKEAPTGVVTVNPSVPTKGPVILTLETNEDVIITNLASSNVYQCEEGNNRKYCVERDENGSFSFKFKDLAGNTGRVSYEVTNIDKEAPERVGEIEYSPVLKDGRTASDTIVTITYNEAINLPENWSYVVDSETGVEDNTKITRTFTGVEDEETLVNENVIVTDLAGNESEEDSINFTIDKKAPEIVGEVEYSPALENGRTKSNTIVTITYNEAIKLAEDSEWTIVDGSNNTKITKTFTGAEDAETVVNEGVVVTDLVGNTSVETTINFTIDKKAPVVTDVTYSPALKDGRADSDTIVTITYDEALKAAPENWEFVSGTTNQITRIFTGAEDAETVVNETISVEDLVENTSVETTINFTIDKKAPEIVGEVEYSPALENGRTKSDTIVTITYNEAIKLAEDSEWTIVDGSNNTKITKTFTGAEDAETVVNEIVNVEDLVGNASVETTINFTIDKKTPVVTDVAYSPILENGRTTNDTTVTITYDEAIKLAEGSEWTIVEGTTNQITRTFTGAANAETVVDETVSVEDLVGNASAETTINFTIDKTAPVVTDVTYSPALENGRTNSDTIVTITYSESVNLPANWDYVVDSETGLVDNTKITRTFIGSEDAETVVNESVVVTDLIGNASEETTINFTIDKKAPSVTSITYIPDLINGNLSTQDVIVVVTYDEALKAAPENWEFVSGTTNQITRTFEGAVNSETKVLDNLIVEDLVGNTSEETLISFTIDKKAPSVTDVTYSPALENGRTTSDTTVTITYDEAIKTAPENWEFVNGTTNQITRTFTGVEDEETIVNEKVSVEDLYGNASEETSINFTIDKKAPEIVGEVEYSPALTGENVTNVDTTVTITYNEAIKLAEDSEWTIVEGTNNTKITRKFVGEAKAETVVNEGVVVTDLVGNTSEEITINFTIDKEAPTGVVTVNPSVPTKGPVILTLETNEDVIITNLASSNVYQCEEGNNKKYCVERNENGSFSFKFKDLAGNTGRVSYEVTNIDKEAPERVGEIEYSPVLKDGRTDSDTTVTITYNEAVNLPENWSYVIDSETGVEDNTKITRTFVGIDNIETIVNESVYVTDLAGNESSEETINFVIDKEAPIAAEIIADPTNDIPAKEVTIFLIPSEKIIITNKESDGVKLFDETVPAYVVTVTENGTFTFEFEDLVGNKGTASYEVTNIDKAAPTVQSIKYNGQEDYNFVNGKTKEDITVVITYNEALKVAPENWEFVSGTTNQITRTFTGAENAETVVNESVVVTDLVGNTSEETTINFTIDKKLPVVTGTIEYSPALKDGRTASDTTVTITYSEAIGSVTGDWTIVDENKITKTFTGVDNIETIVNESVYVTDLAGNVSAEETINFVIDKEAPTGAEIIADPTNDTPAKEVTIFLIPSEKIIITNKESDGVKLFDETLPVYVVTVTENGVFTFEFEDLVGNKGTASYEVTNIDSDVPTVQSIKYNGQEDYNFISGKTKEDITVTIEYSENVVITDTMITNGWSYAKDENNKEIESIITKNFTVLDEEEQSFNENIVVKDVVGHASAEETINFTIDKKAPSVKSSVQAVDVNNTKNVIVTITYDEALKEAPEGWEFIKDSTTQITKTFEGVENSETPITASVVVEDLVGNVSEETINFTIDKKAPSVTNVDYSPVLENGRTSSDTTVTITYDETLKAAPENWEFVSGSTTQITRTFTGEANAETIAKDNVVVEDLVGNASEEQIINFVIDKKVPSVSKVEYSPELTNKELALTNEDTTVTITYDEAIGTLPTGWSFVEGTNNTKITKTFTGASDSDTTINESVSVTDLVGNPITEPIDINFTIDKTIPTLTIYDSVGTVHNTDFADSLEYSTETFNGYTAETNDENATITHTGNINLSQLGEQSITYTVKDKAGNEQSITITVTVVDRILPTVNFSISDKLSQNNGWYNEPIVVNIDGSDVGSGISKYEYQYISDGVVKTGEITNLTDPKFTIDVDGRDISFVITAYDKANNTAQVSGNNYKLDTTNPTLDYTVKTEPSADDNWYNTNISILVNGSDTLSGISKLEYSYSENNGLSWSDFAELTTNDLGIDKESTGLMYKVRVTDIAGNSEVYNIEDIYRLDKTKPVITVTDGKNSYTDNFIIEVQANKNGKYTLPTATVTDNFDKNIKLNATEGSVDITKIGTYYVKYSATDQANNTKELTMTVKVVDTTAPTIKLNGNNPQTVNFGTTYVEQGVTIDDNLDSNLKAVISGDTVNTNKVGEYKVVYSVTDSHNNTTTITRIVKVISTDSSSLIQTTNNCEAGKDCYITSGTNNYVWYSGFLWRIIKVNDDNTVKLITEDSVSGFSYDDDSSVFKDSNVNNWLSTEFYNSLNNNSIITNGNYCIDTLMTTKEYSLETGDNTKTQEYAKANVRYNCNTAYQGKVGLLTIDEYNILGAENSYLNTGDHFFTMTPSTNQTVWVVQTDGIEKAWYRVTNTYAIRPVITISANAKISSGDGSINNPYRIESDKVAQSNDLISTRYTGEYVKFGNQNWRIVSTDATNNSTKLIMDNYYQTDTSSNDYVVVSPINGTNYASLKFGENGLYKGSYVEEYLNNVVYNDLFTNREKSALVTSKWYNSSYTKGQNPLQSLLIKNQYTESSIGLIRMGELMSGTSSTSRVDGFTYWTSSYADDPTYGKYAWFTTWSGATNNVLNRTDIRGLRPVINIKSNISIKSGTGTVNDPYILNY